MPDTTLKDFLKNSSIKSLHLDQKKQFVANLFLDLLSAVKKANENNQGYFNIRLDSLRLNSDTSTITLANTTVIDTNGFAHWNGKKDFFNDDESYSYISADKQTLCHKRADLYDIAAVIGELIYRIGIKENDASIERINKIIENLQLNDVNDRPSIESVIKDVNEIASKLTTIQTNNYSNMLDRFDEKKEMEPIQHWSSDDNSKFKAYLKSIGTTIAPLNTATDDAIIESIKQMISKNSDDRGFQLLHKDIRDGTLFKQIQKGRDCSSGYICLNQSSKEVIGFIIFAEQPTTPPSWAIYDMGVDKNARWNDKNDKNKNPSQGIGTALLFSACNEIFAKHNKVSRIELMAATTEADQFYKKYGFEITDDPDADFDTELVLTRERYGSFCKAVNDKFAKAHDSLAFSNKAMSTAHTLSQLSLFSSTQQSTQTHVNNQSAHDATKDTSPVNSFSLKK